MKYFFFGGGGKLHTSYWWKHLWKKPAGRHKHKWLDNIKVYLQYIGLKGRELDSYGSAKGQEAVWSKEMIHTEVAIKCGEFLYMKNDQLLKRYK